MKKAGYATSLTYADTVTQVYNSVKDLVDESYLKYKKRNTIKNITISLTILATLIGGFYYFKKK